MEHDRASRGLELAACFLWIITSYFQMRKSGLIPTNGKGDPP